MRLHVTSYIELSVRENGFWKVDTNPLECLTLRFIDRHHKGKSQWKLLSAHCEATSVIWRWHCRTWNEDMLANMFAMHYLCLDYMGPKLHNRQSCTVTCTDRWIEVTQQDYRRIFFQQLTCEEEDPKASLNWVVQMETWEDRPHLQLNLHSSMAQVMGPDTCQVWNDWLCLPLYF